MWPGTLARMPSSIGSRIRSSSANSSGDSQRSTSRYRRRPTTVTSPPWASLRTPATTPGRTATADRRRTTAFAGAATSSDGSVRRRRTHRDRVVEHHDQRGDHPTTSTSVGRTRHPTAATTRTPATNTMTAPAALVTMPLQLVCRVTDSAATINRRRCRPCVRAAPCARAASRRAAARSGTRPDVRGAISSAAASPAADVLAIGHRVWKRQPDGGLAGLGTSPWRMMRRRARSRRGSATGTADSSDCVYGCAGVVVERVAVGDLDDPAEIHHATRSLVWRTTERSWAMKMKLSLNSSWISSSRFSTCAWMLTSSADTGSSSTITFGRSASDRAMPMR